MINEIQLVLQQVKNAWNSIASVPDDLSPLGYPGLTKVAVSDTFGGAIETLEELSKKDDFKPSIISLFNLRQAVASINTYVTTHIPSSPQPHLPEMLRLLEVISIGIRGWLEESDRVSKRATASLIHKVAEAFVKVKDAGAIRDELRSYHEEIIAYAATASEQSAKLTKILNDSTASKDSIEANSVESENALDHAKDGVKEIRELTTELIALKKELMDNKASQAKMFSNFEEYRDTIVGLLGDANRAGMATSFRTRKVELKDPLQWWLLMFVLSVLGVVVMGVVYFAPILENGKLEQLPFRLALVSPFIWLGWFSAKQYGYTARLREDYAYKEASAMSFEGYKREASESSEEMLEKLLDVSINNFSDNPIRIYSGTGNHASPLHEALDKSLDYQKLVEAFKDLVAKAKA